MREISGRQAGRAGRGPLDRYEERQDRRGPLDRYEEEQNRHSTNRPAGRSGAAGDNPFGRMLEEMFGGGGTAGGAQGRADSLGEIFDRFARNVPGGPPDRHAGSADTPRAPTGRDIFGDMFEPARTMGDSYQRNIEQIFDTFLGKPNKRT